MSSRKSTRTTRQTRKHLATDFEWEGLPAFDIPPSHPEQRGDDDNLPLLANQLFRKTPYQSHKITPRNCSHSLRTVMTTHPLHISSRLRQRLPQSSYQNRKLPKHHRIQNSRQQTPGHSNTNTATCSDSCFLKNTRTEDSKARTPARASQDLLQHPAASRFR